VQHTKHTNIHYICQKIDIFLRAFGGSLGSVLNYHAAVQGSIPHCASVMKVVCVFECLSVVKCECLSVFKCGVVQR